MNPLDPLQSSECISSICKPMVYYQPISLDESRELFVKYQVDSNLLVSLQ